MSFVDLSKTFGNGEGRVNARNELEALETEYQELYGYPPKFDVSRHRKRSIYVDELKEAIAVCKRELAYA